MHIRYFAICMGVAANLAHALPANDKPGKAGGSTNQAPSTSRSRSSSPKPFEFKFDVNAASDKDYQTWINGFRRAATVKTVGSVGVLRSHKDPIQFFDVDLVTKSKETQKQHQVTVKLQKDNLYLVAHKGETGGWQRLSDVKDTTIPGATPLNFSSDYKILGNFANYPGADGLYAREKTVCSKYKLGEAIQNLASDALAKQAIDKNKSNKGATPLSVDAIKARSYLLLIQMLSESIRLYNVSDFMVEHWENEATPTSDLLQLENKWSKLGTDSSDVAVALDDSSRGQANTSKTDGGKKAGGKPKNKNT
ncbi:hypothetical protein AA313_de0207010 [Arthrobotrys entomopaga]|nr:hypothetical protein AA313_de0207010 [Arthrobotrys entomopaga]